MDTTQIGGILIAGGLLAFVLGKLPTARSVALFLGVVLVGTNGHLLSWLTVVMGWLAGITSGAFAWAFGVAVPGLLAFGLIFYLAHAWHPKGGQAGRLASILAVALGVMVAAGITNVGLLNQVHP